MKYAWTASGAINVQVVRKSRGTTQELKHVGVYSPGLFEWTRSPLAASDVPAANMTRAAFPQVGSIGTPGRSCVARQIVRGRTVAKQI